MTETNIWFEQEIIRQADEGDSQAGRKALEIIASRIEIKQFDSPLFSYLAESIKEFLHEGISLDRALGVEDEPNKGGRPRKYDEVELAAVDLLLRNNAGFTPEEAVEWIEENVGADRRAIQRLRSAYDARYNKFGADKLMESRGQDDLLDMSGSMRKKVGGVLPQT
jgi:hypothetical protein